MRIRRPAQPQRRQCVDRVCTRRSDIGHAPAQPVRFQFLDLGHHADRLCGSDGSAGGSQDVCGGDPAGDDKRQLFRVEHRNRERDSRHLAWQRSQSCDRLSDRDLLLRVRNGSAVRWYVFLATEPVRLLGSRKFCCRAWRLRHGAGELFVFAGLCRFKPCIEPNFDEHRARKASID